MQARSSGGERYLDAVEAGGSRPPVPTGRMMRDGQRVAVPVVKTEEALLK